jgi:hypothetical protein
VQLKVSLFPNTGLMLCGQDVLTQQSHQIVISKKCSQNRIIHLATAADAQQGPADASTGGAEYRIQTMQKFGDVKEDRLSQLERKWVLSQIQIFQIHQSA